MSAMFLTGLLSCFLSVSFAQNAFLMNEVGGDKLWNKWEAYGPYKHIKKPYLDLFGAKKYEAGKSYGQRTDSWWWGKEATVPFMCHMKNVKYNTYLSTSGCGAALVKKPIADTNFWFVTWHGRHCIRSVKTGKYLTANSWTSRAQPGFGRTYWNREDCNSQFESWNIPEDKAGGKFCMRNAKGYISANPKKWGGISTGPARCTSDDAKWRLYCRMTRPVTAKRPYRFQSTWQKFDTEHIYKTVGKFTQRNGHEAYNMFQNKKHAPRGHVCYFKNPSSKLYLGVSPDHTGIATKTVGDVNMFWVDSPFGDKVCIKSIHGFFLTDMMHAFTTRNFKDAPKKIFFTSPFCDDQGGSEKWNIEHVSNWGNWARLRAASGDHIRVSKAGQLSYQKGHDRGSPSHWQLFCKDSNYAKAPVVPSHTLSLFNTWVASGSWNRIVYYGKDLHSVMHPKEFASKFNGGEENSYLCTIKARDGTWMKATDHYGMTFSKTFDASNQFWFRHHHGQFYIRTIHGKYMTSDWKWKRGKQCMATVEQPNREDQAAWLPFQYKKTKFIYLAIHPYNYKICKEADGTITLPKSVPVTDHKKCLFEWRCKKSVISKTCLAAPPAPPQPKPRPRPRPPALSPRPAPRPAPAPVPISTREATKVITKVIQAEMGTKPDPQMIKKIVTKEIQTRRRPPTPGKITRIITKIIHRKPSKRVVSKVIRKVVRPAPNGVGRWVYLPPGQHGPKSLVPADGPWSWPLVSHSKYRWPHQKGHQSLRDLYSTMFRDILYHHQLRHLLYRDRLHRLRTRRDVRDVIFRKRLQDIFSNPPLQKCAR